MPSKNVAKESPPLVGEPGLSVNSLPKVYVPRGDSGLEESELLEPKFRAELPGVASVNPA